VSMSVCECVCEYDCVNMRVCLTGGLSACVPCVHPSDLILSHLT
jgi:hypothetical protein